MHQLIQILRIVKGSRPSSPKTEIIDAQKQNTFKDVPANFAKVKLQLSSQKVTQSVW